MANWKKWSHLQPISMNKCHPCSIVLDRNQVKKIAEQNAIVRAISGFPVFLCEMLQLLLLLLNFQLGRISFYLVAVAHFFSSIVFISELQGPCLPWHPYELSFLPLLSFTSHQVQQNSLCVLTDRWCGSLARVLQRLVGEVFCQGGENTRSISSLSRCFLPLHCAKVSLETEDRQLLCQSVSSPCDCLSSF